MAIGRFRLTVCYLIAWVAGLAGAAGIQMFTEPGWGWFGVVLLMGAVLSAVPAAIALAVLVALARPIGENPLPFALLGPLLVVAGTELFGLGVPVFAGQVAVTASIVFYALAKLWGPKPEPDPY